MAELKGFIFDMDGTLIDNWAYHVISFNEFLRRKRLTPIRELSLDLNGRHSDDIFRIMLGEEQCSKYSLDELNYEKEDLYREMYHGHVEPIEGLMELFKEAKAKGIKCAIGSSGCRANVDFIIRELNLENIIDASISGNDVSHGKPHPEIFTKAHEAMGLKAEECIVFEDAVNGIKAGVAAGCKCVGLTTTATVESLCGVGAELCVKDYTELSLTQLEKLVG